MGHLQLHSLQPEIDALKQVQENLAGLKHDTNVLMGIGNNIELDYIEIKEIKSLKSVFCNYRGRLTVYDTDSQKVPELSGQLTYEKHIELEKRIDWDTIEFEGHEDYISISKELVRKFKIDNSTVYFNNITDSVQEVELFGAYKNKASNNYGNPDGIIVSGENYQCILNDIIIKPIKIESVRVCSYNDELKFDIIIKNTNANGVCSQVLLSMQNYHNQFGIVQADQQFIINVGTSICFKIKPNEKVGVDIIDNLLVFNIYG